MRWFGRGVRIAARVAALIAIFIFIGCVTILAAPHWFNGLLARQALTFLLERPILLAQTGIVDADWLNYFADELGGDSLDARQNNFDQLRRFEAEIQQWDRSKLTTQEQLSYDIILWSYNETLTAEKYPWLGADGELYPANQAFGAQIDLPRRFTSTDVITNERSAINYVRRLKAFGELVGEIQTDVARQARLGVIPPDFIIDESIAQMKSLIQPPPGRNPLVVTLADRMAKAGLNIRARKELEQSAADTVRDHIYPAYRSLIAREVALRRQATHDAGIWRLPGGDAYYADQLKYLTSTEMSPSDVHNYGLSEVERISRQMDSILRSIGLVEGSVGNRIDKLMADPNAFYENTETDRIRMLSKYAETLKRAQTMLPRYFIEIPTIPLEVHRIAALGEIDSTEGAYYPPSLNGKRPGVFAVNLHNVDGMPMWGMPTLAYHEGFPGHHLQASIALQNHDIPLLQRLQYFPAFNEGWALYAEHLASDMGLYKDDPLGDLGRLQAELFRATRLVVDTGMHAKRWSREQAIQYMQTTTGMALSDVTWEIDRYVVWPGQACTYTIGMKVILGLRDEAIVELGTKFNLKEFHAQILKNGPMPLWLLQQNVRHWITEKRDEPVILE